MQLVMMMALVLSIAEVCPIGLVHGESTIVPVPPATQTTNRRQFDIEQSIVKAVVDQLETIVSVPIRAVKVIETHLNNGGFGPDGIG